MHITAVLYNGIETTPVLYQVIILQSHLMHTMSVLYNGMETALEL